MNLPARREKGKHLFGKFLDSERSFGEHVFMTTNARSMTSPVSTSANQFQTVRSQNVKTPGDLSRVRTSQDLSRQWWERPPTSPGSLHVSLRADRTQPSFSPVRVGASAPHRVRLAPVQGVSDLRTGAPAIQNRCAGGKQASSRARLGVLAGIVLAVFVGGFGIANASSSSRGEVRSYLVRPGDSFWSIARSVQSQGDLRPLVADLIEAHGSNVLQVGDLVVLPGR
jgi:hypothetical protein